VKLYCFVVASPKEIHYNEYIIDSEKEINYAYNGNIYRHLRGYERFVKRHDKAACIILLENDYHLSIVEPSLITIRDN